MMGVNKYLVFHCFLSSYRYTHIYVYITRLIKSSNHCGGRHGNPVRRISLYLLTQFSRVLPEKLTGFAANQEIPRILWNPKVHYRTHKRPPYPQPTPSSPHNPFPLPEDPSYYYPPIYVLVSPTVSFPQVSPPKPSAHLSLPPYVPHALPISFFAILSPAQY